MHGIREKHTKSKLIIMRTESTNTIPWMIVSLRREMLERMLHRRESKCYFANTYATSADLRDICVRGKEITVPEELHGVWERIERCLLTHLNIWTLPGSKLPELRIGVRGLTEKEQRLIEKNCRDYMLHSAASEILEGIHPNMAMRAYQKGIAAICRVCVSLRRGRRRAERKERNLRLRQEK